MWGFALDGELWLWIWINGEGVVHGLGLGAWELGIWRGILVVFFFTKAG